MHFRLTPQDIRPYTNYIEADKAIREKKTVVSHTPTHVCIEVTTRCNLSCEHCCNPIYPLVNRDLDRKIFGVLDSDILPDAAAVQYTCLGETFLCRNLDRVFELLEKHTSPFSKIFTNGQIMTPELAERVLKSGLKELAFSVDGAIPDTYEFIRRGGYFEILIRNLTLLLEIKQKNCLNEPVFTFNVVVMKENIGELEALVEMAVKYGAQQIHFFDLFARTEKIAERSPRCFSEATRRSLDCAFMKGKELGIEVLTNISFSDPGWLNKVIPRIVSFYNLHWKFINTRIDGFLFYVTQRKKVKSDEKSGEIILEAEPENGSFCEHPWKYIAVKVDGSITPCRYLSIVLGNLHDQKFDKIWNSPMYMRLRQSILDGSYDMCGGATCPFMRNLRNLSAQIEVLEKVSTYKCGEKYSMTVKVLNNGSVMWNSSSQENLLSYYTLSYHIFSESGDVEIFDGLRTSLPYDIKPTTSVIFNIDVQMPEKPGNYIICLDIVKEMFTWFGDIGNPTCSLSISVE